MRPVKLKNNLLSFINDERLMLFFSLAAIIIVNGQVLFTFFFSDDFLHFYQISNWHPLEFIFSSIGGHLYIFRNLVFYCMFKLFGLNSVAYFSIVLLTHLGCAFILYKIIHLLTGKATLAAAGMMIWGITPANYSALSWYSAYGHLLVGFFFLLFLYDLLRIEKGTILFSRHIAIRWSIYLLLMATSYGIGLTIACLSPVAIVIILWRHDEKWKIAASTFPAITIILLLFIFKDAIYYYFSGIISNSSAALLKVPLLVALSNYKIILELFITQCTLNIYFLTPFPFFLVLVTMLCPKCLNLFFTTIPVVIAIPAVILFVVLFSRSHRYRRHYAGLSIFFLGLMGLLAYIHGADYKINNLVGILLVFDTRFYYVTLMIAVIILTLMADELLDVFSKYLNKIVPCLFIILAISIYPSLNLAKEMDFGNGSGSEYDRKIYHDTIADIEKTIRSRPEGSSVVIDNTMNEKISLYPTLQSGFPGKAAIFAITYPHNTFEGRRVYFVERDCHVVDQNTKKKHWRMSSLIISACDRNKSN